MSQNPLAQLANYGQSFWYDNIHRAMISSGELDGMLAQDDLRGITSNPTIFEKAITSSNDYDAQLGSLVRAHPSMNVRDYFFALAVEDIQAAADKLLPVYTRTQGADGYVSLEVSPDLAHDTQGTIAEAKSLHARLNRPNVMIKVPATKAGVPAVEELIAAGINVNVTLLFSVERYVEVGKAYINGLNRRHAHGQTVNGIASVASFFISRVDAILDKNLGEKRASLGAADQARLDGMMGKTAILNAKIAYLRYQEMFGANFKVLSSAGATPQRLLWASTGTKDPKYKDTLYIDSLIGADTVNTIPPATVKAFRDHGTAASTLTLDMNKAEAQVAEIGKWVNIPAAMEQLEKEGVASFAKSFETLLGAISAKIGALAPSAKSSAA